MNSCVQELKNHIHDGKELINVGECKVGLGYPVYVIAKIFQGITGGNSSRKQLVNSVAFNCNLIVKYCDKDQ